MEIPNEQIQARMLNQHESELFDKFKEWADNEMDGDQEARGETN